MKTRFLFPNSFKKVGWVLLIPSTILGILILFFDVEFKFMESNVFTIYTEGFNSDPAFFTLTSGNYASTIAGIMFLIGAIFVAFSEQKEEDEFIARTRMESLMWAVYINYGVLIFCFLFFFQFEFLEVMIFNMFTILIFFIIRFYYILYKNNKSLGHEK